MLTVGFRHSNTRICWKVSLLGSLLFVILLTSCAVIYTKVGGDFQGPPADMWTALSPGAVELIVDAFAGIEPDRLVDFHVHVAGSNASKDGIYVNPVWLSWWHPIKRIRTNVYMSAAKIDSQDTAESDYLNRLLELIAHFPKRGRFLILALDKYYNPNGSEDLERTSLYVPNGHVAQLSEKHPDTFVPVMSVHPYRSDALEELEKWANKGCRYVKWLPNAMGIDPSSKRVEAFYGKMRELDLILLTHTGDELAVDAHDLRRFGNPLLLRKPLDMGVKIVAFHSASLGTNVDLEDPLRRQVPSFDLFLRLMDEQRYQGLLFGEISATTFFNHLPHPLYVLLEREDLHHRLVNGSDYPLPAINFVTQTRALVRAGFITAEERKQLNEIYVYNPLLFDYVVKRTVKHPKTGRRFSDEVFMIPEPLRSARSCPVKKLSVGDLLILVNFYKACR